MPTAADISTQIRAALALSVPDLDTSIGSVAGRLIDAIANPMAEAFLDNHLSSYSSDIDSKTAGDLEAFVRLFGMNRRQARAAVGTVTFARSAATAAQSVAVIPVGTQVQSNTNPVVVVQTTASAVMAIGQTSVDVPVQAIQAGAAGNIAAGTLVLLVSDVQGVSTTTTNADAMTRGRDLETDDALRTRWKQTVFRNLAGVAAMYRAIALEADDTVTAVNVLGARKTWLDRITVSGGVSSAVSFGNPDYIYPTNVFVGPDLGAANLLSQGTDYTVTINNGVSPATITIQAVGGGNMPDGDYDLQFDYVPTYSRNNPFGTRFGENAFVNNRIDIWTNGLNPQQVTQACKFTNVLRFSSSSTDPLYLGNFQTLDGKHPAANDVFMPLGFAPIVSVPNALTINGTEFTEGTHYDIVHRSDAFGYGPTSQAGLVWYAAGTLPTASDFTITYVYNAVPALIQQLVQNQWRLLGTDCQVHAGIVKQYRFHLAVVYERNFDTSAVNTAIDAAISALIEPLGFDSSLQVSDVLQAVHNVPGVDNVRFLNSGDDGTHYAIEQITAEGNPFVPAVVAEVGGRATDVYFDDATFPVFHSTRILAKTRTNFGTA